MKKNFRKIKIGQRFLNNFDSVVTIISQEGHQSIDENGIKYNNSGNCMEKGRNWNLRERIN